MLTEATFWIGVGGGALGVTVIAGFFLWKRLMAFRLK